MRPFLSVAATVIAATSAFAQSSFTINTPGNAVVCQPLLINWSGGNGPYYLSVLPGSDPTGTAIEDLGQFSGTSYTWNVNIAAGTQIGLTLRDSSGNLAQTAAFTINPGSDSSCVGKPVSSGSSSGTTATSSSASGSSGASHTGASSLTTSLTGTSSPSTAPTTAATTGATGASASNGSSGTATASSTATHSNAASVNVVKVGTAGFFGVALVALLA